MTTTGYFPGRAAPLLALLALFAPALAAGPPLAEVREVLRTQALVPPDEGALAALTADGIGPGLRQIDRYAELLPPETPDAADRTEDERPRLGAELYESDGRLWLLPYQDGPLWLAGQRGRAALLAVAGREVAGADRHEVARWLVPTGGDGISLQLCEPPCATPRTLKVPLAPFRPAAVEVLPIHGEVVLRIRAFTPRETRILLLELARQLGQPSPLIIDLRDALGGDLYEALDTAGLFLHPGTSLGSAIDREGRERTFQAPGGDKLTQPVALLIGPDTASAAELFAGALLVHGRARLVGRTTRGKCRSQTDALLSEGYRLRYTNLALRLPDGTDCQGRGLQPGLVVTAEELAETGRLVDLALGRALEPRSSTIPQIHAN